MEPDRSQALELRALWFLNAARDRFGLSALRRIPRGVPGDGGVDCIVTKSIPCVKYTDLDCAHIMNPGDADLIRSAWNTRQVDPGNILVRMPAELRDFTKRFDAGDYPELTIRRRYTEQ